MEPSVKNSTNLEPTSNGTITDQQNLQPNATNEPTPNGQPLTNNQEKKKDECVVDLNDEVKKLHAQELPVSEELLYFDSDDEDSLPELDNIDVFKQKLNTDFLNYVQSNVTDQNCLNDIELGKLNPNEISVVCANKTDQEKNILLLWAVYLGKYEYFSDLITCGADAECSDVNGFTPLHWCAYNGNLKGCEFFLAAGVNVNAIGEKYTPLHCAALGNSPKIVKLLLSKGAKIEYYKDGVIGEGTALHSAIKMDALECLQLLIRDCVNINSLEPGGWCPLHLAADLGRYECMNMLLNVNGIKLNVKSRDKDSTPLHLAAKNGHADCVTLLIDKGANPQEMNVNGQTPLHLAARGETVECVEALLASKDCDVDARDDEQRTPLHAAVGKDGKEPEIVKVLIRHKAAVDAKDKYGCTPLYIAALNEQYECIETLVEHDADLGACSNAGVSVLRIIGRKIPAALEVFHKKLDESITVHDPKASHQDVELVLDFDPFLQHSTEGEIDFLKKFIDERQKDILEHPLCQAFIYLKWRKIRKYYTARLVFWFLLVLSYSCYTYTMAHACYKVVVTKTIIWNRFLISPDVISTFWHILLLITLFETFRKLYSLPSYSSFMQYVKIPENIFEWYVILSIYVMLFSQSECIQPWQEGVGGIGVLLAWTNMMFKLGQLPFFESYVAMYLKVQRDFGKLFLAYACLLIGFTICFCVILPSSDEFTYPHVGFLKTLVMATGELNLINFLTTERANTDGFFIILFPLFVLFVTIVLMNLLVGIAVHDIQGLQKTATRSKLDRQVRLISHIESSLFNIHFHLPKYFIHMLKDTALLSSKSNRVTIHVKPHHPRERKLPRELLESLYKLYLQKKRSKRTIPTSVQSSAGRSNYRPLEGRIDANASVGKTIQDLSSRLEDVSQSNKMLVKEIGQLKKTVLRLVNSLHNKTVENRRVKS